MRVLKEFLEGPVAMKALGTTGRLLLIAALFVTGLASGLAAFVLLLFAFMSGLEIAVVAIAALVTFHTTLCGITLERLKRGDDQPWTWIALILILSAAMVVAVYRFS